MAVKIIDSSSDLNIPVCISSAKTNQLTLHNLCPKYTKGKITIDAPLNIISKFDNIIFDNLIRMDIPTEYYYSPERFAKYKYGTSDLWWLVLYSGHFTRHTDFCIPSAYMADPSVVS